MDSEWMDHPTLMNEWNKLTSDQHTWVSITADMHNHSKEWVLNTMTVPSHKECQMNAPGLTYRQKRRRRKR